MGTAEAIPGVSGGTIAFITGIYSRLIAAIKSVDLEALKLLFSFRLKDFWNKIDGNFIITLGIGMVLGIGISIFTITELLARFPEYLWAFFFGLILASAAYVASTIKVWKPTSIVLLILGVAFAVLVCRMSPVTGSSSGLYIFICGAIAISALILPGISGSFMLLILGMYTTILGSVRGLLEDFQMIYLQNVVIFALGCIVGLVLFSRVVSWAFERYENQILALMTGFILGSLYKIWPWRNPTLLIQDDGTQIAVPAGSTHESLEAFKILKEKLVMPSEYILADVSTLVVLGCAFLGALIVFLMGRKK